MSWLSGYRRFALEAAGAAALAFVWFAPLLHDSTFFIFAARDLARAREAAGGRLYFFGPEAWGGGFLPGGFYYWLVSLAFLAGDSWRAAWYWMACLMGTGLGILWFWLRVVSSWNAAAFGLAFFLSSIPVVVMLKLFYNPSHLAPFVFAQLALLTWAYAGGRRRHWGWWIFCFVFALSLQIHFSVLPLLFAAAATQALAPRLGLRRVEWRAFLWGLPFLVVPLLPYALLSWLQPDSSEWLAVPPHAEPLSGSAVNLAGSFWRALWSLPTANMRTNSLVVLGLPLLVGLVISCFSSPADLRGSRERAVRRLVLVSLLATVPSFLAAETYVFATFVRYTFVFHLVMLMFASLWVGSALSRRPSSVTIALCLLCLAGGFYLRNYPTGRTSSVSLRAAARLIYSQTGWSFAEARRRMYWLDIYPDVSMETIYEEERRDLAPPTRPAAVGGFFVLNPVGGFGRPGDMIAARSPPVVLREAIESGELALGEVQSAGRLQLISYRNTRGTAGRLPEFFQNVGYVYEPSPVGGPWPLAEVSGTWAVREVGEGLVASKDLCRPLGRCPLFISLLPEGKDFRLRVDGPAFGSPHLAVTPYATAALVRPFYSLRCGAGGKRVEGRLTDVVGFLGSGFANNDTFLAPWEKRFTAPCAWRNLRVEVGWMNLHVFKTADFTGGRLRSDFRRIDGEKFSFPPFSSDPR